MKSEVDLDVLDRDCGVKGGGGVEGKSFASNCRSVITIVKKIRNVAKFN